MDLIWSKTANDSYIDVIEQTFERWNITIVERFEKETQELLDKIQFHNHICPKSKVHNLHKCTINNVVSLVYRIQNHTTIEIVTFLFNRSSHKF